MEGIKCIYMSSKSLAVRKIYKRQFFKQRVGNYKVLNAFEPDTIFF